MHGERERWRGKTRWRMDKADKLIQDTARGTRRLFRHAGGETMHRHIRHLQNECRWSLMTHWANTCRSSSLQREAQREDDEDLSSRPPRRWTCFRAVLDPELHPASVVNRCGFSSHTPIVSIRVCAFSHVRLLPRAHRSPSCLLFLYLKICFHSHCEPQECHIQQFHRQTEHTSRALHSEKNAENTHKTTPTGTSATRKPSSAGSPKNFTREPKQTVSLGLNGLAETLLDINPFQTVP